MSQNYIPVFRVQLIREGRCEGRRRINCPQDVAEVLRSYLGGADREHFVVLLMDTGNRIIGLNTVAIGTLNATTISAREVFKPAILANTASVILGHNHPSGNMEPSPEDVQLTKQLIEAGKLLGIEVLDHVIVGDGYVSLKEKGLI